ncbi:ArsR family transcriptional regulator [Actinomycetospora lutea]|uniref:arsenate reductase/protein-tyrosine-phosphatase family protein n=1 Tax=Actinomycetospora lutea TaxID=663604 RepID=UPI0023667B06|nr:ArsR family transcriptional regulator [Actinomycetospora lutea]MDD7941021.1 ArsR family transcriptional regulator [Actinomycetospora lutea]
MPLGSQDTVPPAFVQLAAHPVRWRLMTELAGSDLRVRELVTRLAEPQNLVSYHLRLLRDGGLVRATRSSADRRDSYYHLDLGRCADELAGSGTALHPALRTTPSAPPVRPGTRPPSILFVCTGNSARSPVAEALLSHRSAGAARATSAGSRPKEHLHPAAVRVLRERFGIDVSDRRPRHLDDVAAESFDLVVTLCDKAREDCPEFPGHVRRVHWSIPDPAGLDAPDHAAFERAADDIDGRVRHLLPVLATTDPREDER